MRRSRQMMGSGVNGLVLPWGLALMVGLGGCSPSPPEGPAEPRDPQRGVAEAAEGGAAPARALALGEGEPEAFAPYREGEPVALQLGFQGGLMITPRLRVEALADDPESQCWQLRLRNDIDDTAADAPEVGPGLAAQLHFARHGDAYYSDPVNNLLGFDADALRGWPLLLEVSAKGDGVDASTAVSVVLE